MKTPTEIKQKIRNLEFEYLKTVYQAHLSKEPQNCIYNKKAVLPGTDAPITRVCGYFSDEETVQVCNRIECSQNCNAFAPRQDKKTLRALLEEDVEKNPTKYPEIMVLSWVLDGDQTGLPELQEPAIVTADVTATAPPVTASVWKRVKAWAYDQTLLAYLKYIELLGKVFK